MTNLFAPNPMFRDFSDGSEKQPLQEVFSVKDHRGDEWKLKSNLERNSTHPHHFKASGPDKKVVNQVAGWVNQRTGEVHEGSVHVGTSGTASVGDGYSRFFHMSHYNKPSAAVAKVEGK